MAKKSDFSRGIFTRGILTGDFLPKLMPHHRQGTLDGACGFYCLSMILDYFELCDPNKEVADRRTRLGKYLASLQRSSLLVKGLYERELRNVTEFFSSQGLQVEQTDASDFGQLKDFVECLSRQAVPRILRFQIDDGSKRYDHYGVTVGTDRYKIFLMDPALDAQEGSLYNNYLCSRRRDSVWDIVKRRVISMGPCLAIHPGSFQPSDDLVVATQLTG